VGGNLIKNSTLSHTHTHTHTHIDSCKCIVDAIALAPRCGKSSGSISREVKANANEVISGFAGYESAPRKLASRDDAETGRDWNYSRSVSANNVPNVAKRQKQRTAK